MNPWTEARTKFPSPFDFLEAHRNGIAGLVS
jgi:hypothetical protein